MENKKVPGAKISSLIAFHVIGSALVLGSGDDANQDSWITMAAATGVALLLAWIYSAILRLHPGKNVFDIFVDVFGNIGGKIVCGLYVLYAFLLGEQVFAIFDDFIRIVNLDVTPTAAVLLMSVPLIVGLVKSGLKTLASCAKFVFPIVIVVTACTVALGMHFMDIGNIKPILAADPGTLFHGTFYSLALSLGETVLCLSFFGEVDQKENPFRIMSKGILFGGILLTVVILRNFLLLGSPTCRLFVFTSYDAVGVISVGDFLTRTSVVVGIELTLTGVIKLGSTVYSAALGVSKILGLKKFLQPVAPCCALMAALSFTFYENVVMGLNLAKYSPVVSVPIQILMPIVVLIVGKIKQGKKKKGAAKKAAPAKEAAPAPKEPAL